MDSSRGCLVGMSGVGWLTAEGAVTRNIDDAMTYTPEEAVVAALDPEVHRMLASDAPKGPRELRIIVMEIVSSWEQTRANARNAAGCG